jgi:predicted  nucleic acid-binding Zn-ribbon protein
LLILTALLLGALLSFAYSYAPLHRAKDWKIDYLEERLEARNAHVLELEAQLREARASLEGTASDDEVRALRTRLDEATRLAESREQEITDLEQKLESASRARDSWKSRHAAIAANLEGREETAPVADAEAPSGESALEPAPAAPSPLEFVGEGELADPTPAED